MKICKKCGTLYGKGTGVCPKCAANEAMVEHEGDAPLEMSEEELKKARIKSWIWILVGVPAFIGFIYGIFYLMKLLGR